MSAVCVSSNWAFYLHFRFVTKFPHLVLLLFLPTEKFIWFFPKKSARIDLGGLLNLWDFVLESLKGLVMSYSSSDPPYCCSTASPELKLYQAFIFSVPIFFTFILLLLFYLFYLRRRRVDWSSLRMRTPNQGRGVTSSPAVSFLPIQKFLQL